MWLHNYLPVQSPVQILLQATDSHLHKRTSSPYPISHLQSHLHGPHPALDPIETPVRPSVPVQCPTMPTPVSNRKRNKSSTPQRKSLPRKTAIRMTKKSKESDPSQTTLPFARAPAPPPVTHPTPSPAPAPASTPPRDGSSSKSSKASGSSPSASSISSASPAAPPPSWLCSFQDEANFQPGPFHHRPYIPQQ